MEVPSFLAFHCGYQTISVGLYQGLTQQSFEAIELKKASKLLINSIHNVLHKADCALQHLDFIASHKGPAPLTSLRVLLATVNGLSFATQLPAIGIDGLTALIEEYHNQTSDYTIAILNAFSDELFVGILAPDGSITVKCLSIDSTYQYLQSLYPASITLVGNGIEFLLSYGLTKNIHPETHIHEPRLDTIAQLALQSWNEKTVSFEILPTYLKGTPIIKRG